MSDAKTEVKQRIDTIESSYEFFLAYAAQGRTTDEGAKAGAAALGTMKAEAEVVPAVETERSAV